MGRDFDIVTFDCYGTLVDWETGISDSFLAEAARDGLAFDRDEVLRQHALVEPQVQQGSNLGYREVLIETAIRMAANLGWSLERERACFLPDGLVDWAIFPDTNAALQRLIDGGHELGILSNIEDEMLAGTLRQFDVSFDLIVTAQQVGSYKPAHGHFLTAGERIGEKRWLHAAQSWFHDVEPAHALGVPVIWVNRKNESPSGPARPRGNVPDMRGLAELLA